MWQKEREKKVKIDKHATLRDSKLKKNKKGAEIM